MRALQETDPKLALRGEAAVALSKIADKRVINPLIETMTDVNIGEVVDEQLRKITHAQWGERNTADRQIDPRPSFPKPAEYQAWLKRRQQRWRQWWQEQGEKIELDRRAAYKHVGPY